MLARSMCICSLVASNLGLHMQKPRDHKKSLHVEEAQANQQLMSHYYEDLDVTAGLKAILDPFRSGNENLWLVSVETRLGRRFQAKDGDFEKNFQKGYENIYEEVFTDGLNRSSLPQFPLQAKARILKAWSTKQAEQHPDELVLFLDHDTVYVGCSEEQLLADVHQVFAHSNADLILGAELNCAPRTVWKDQTYHCAIEPGKEGKDAYLLAFEHYLGNHDKKGKDSDFMSKTVYPEVPSWARSLYNLNDQTWRTHAAAFVAQPEAKFLNSGLVVGKARDFAKIFNWLNKSPREGGYRNPFGSQWYNDQHGFNMAYYDTVHGNTGEGTSGVKVTLDFGSRLMFNLYGISEEDPPYQRMADGTYMNTFTGKQACFIHGNGRKHGVKKMFNKIQAEIKEERPDLLLETFGRKPK